MQLCNACKRAKFDSLLLLLDVSHGYSSQALGTARSSERDGREMQSRFLTCYTLCCDLSNAMWHLWRHCIQRHLDATGCGPLPSQVWSIAICSYFSSPWIGASITLLVKAYETCRMSCRRKYEGPMMRQCFKGWLPGFLEVILWRTKAAVVCGGGGDAKSRLRVRRTFHICYHCTNF
jgi:hypothetical protein